MWQRALSCAGGSIDPIIADTLSGFNTSTFTYVSVPQKPKYVLLTFYNANVGGVETCEWINNATVLTYYYGGTYYKRTSTSYSILDVQNDKVGFKAVNSEWTNPTYTICF